MLAIGRVERHEAMGDHWMWWAGAALLAGAELLTGTFYLLAVCVAFVIVGFIAWMGAGLPAQLLIGGGLSFVAVVLAHQWRRRRGMPPLQPPLDLGQAVRVNQWRPDGTARVEYRGTQWDAEVASPGVVRADTMYIVDTRGSTLVLSDRRP